MTPYEVLGVPVGASVDEIRRAYLLLARRHHPDFHAGESPERLAEAGRRMQAVNEAWAALSDTGTRQRYERAEAERFRPFEDVGDDEPDPRDAPDVPYRTSRPPSALERAAVFASVGLFAFAMAAAAVGLMTSTGLLAVSALAVVLSAVGFLVVALLALGRAARDEG
ncbi:MAG: J domain-containing protein [Acidimicrobiia bacterium]